jgi:short-subunit dehydrogenase involved in D-alanine esterification of teichoic acids
VQHQVLLTSVQHSTNLISTGIGEALANRFVEEGSCVIAVGRRQDKLEALVDKHGKDKVKAVSFDITDLAGIPDFVRNIIKSNEDIDCIFMNSGIQRKADFSNPESVDMGVINEELTVNYLAPLALTKAFLPYLQSKNSDSCLMYTTSGLALVPAATVPNYCASKAAMHHFILCLREQLKRTHIKVVELIPPAVQTELHDAKHQPDTKDGRLIGMPLDQFTNEV